jgi:LPS export ABC transporter protein LptC
MIKPGLYKLLLQAAFIWSCLFFYSCENDPGEVNRDNTRKPNIEEGYNIESFLSQNGNLRAKLTAPFMLRYTLDTSYIEFPRKLHVNFYDSSGKVESQVDALYGKYLETQSKVYLRDSVVVFNVKGDTLWTPDLWWDQNAKRFYTNNRVRIRRKDQRIIGGKGMEATQDLNNIFIYQLESPSYITVPDSMIAN